MTPRTTGYRRLLLLAVLAAAFMVTLLSSATPSHATPSRPAGPTAPVQQSPTPGTCTPPQASAQPDEATEEAAARGKGYLPLNRWGDSAAGVLHTRLGSGWNQDLRQKISRDMIAANALSFGNAFWQAGSGIVEFASGFQVLDQAGCSADAAAASIGSAMTESGLITALFVGGIVVLVWRAASQGGGFSIRPLVRSILILGLFAIMLSGAQQTVATGVISRGSPAWFATQLTHSVSALASAPANSLAVDASGLSTRAEGTNVTSCGPYVAALKQRYQDQFGGDLTSMRASVPLVMSAMWEESGLSVWISAQFGSQNRYGDYVYCRLLEHQAGINAGPQRSLMVSDRAASVADSWAQIGGDRPVTELMSPRDNVDEDRRIIGWAACRWDGNTWTVDPGWGPDNGAEGTARRGIREGEQVTTEDCEKWWSEAELDEGNGVDWHDSGSRIREDVADDQTRDFLLNFHGDVVSSAITVSIVYVLVALIVLFVFGILGLGVIVAKVAGVVMAAMVFVVFAMSILPSNQGSTRLERYIKFFLGMTIYSFGLQFVLALVATVTRFLHQMGDAVYGSGSLLSIIWLGIAPLTAIVVLHMVFKHGLGAPSPFKPSGALAWGGAFAGGAAVGVGLDRMFGRGSHMARGMAHGAGARVMYGRGRGRAGTAAAAALGGRAGSRKHAMAPDDANKKTRRERWAADVAAKGARKQNRDEQFGPATGLKQRAIRRNAMAREAMRTRAQETRETASLFFRSRNWKRAAAAAGLATAWAGPVGLLGAGAAAASGLAGAGAAVGGAFAPATAALGAASAGTSIATAGLGGAAAYAFRKRRVPAAMADQRVIEAAQRQAESAAREGQAAVNGLAVQATHAQSAEVAAFRQAAKSALATVNQALTASATRQEAAAGLKKVDQAIRDISGNGRDGR